METVLSLHFSSWMMVGRADLLIVSWPLGLIPGEPDTRRPPDLHGRNCRRQISHAHQVVGRAGEGKDPVHFANSAMPYFSQERDRLQPAETFFDSFPLPLADPVSRVPRRARINGASARPGVILGQCGVTCRFRHSATNPSVSNPLSPPTVTAFVPGSFSSITNAASRSAVPLASNASASTISPFRFSTSRLPL